MTDIKKGDRVKVTTEVEILSPEAVRVNTLGNGAVYGYRALFKGVAVVVPADATIEKIEAPVVTFKPGDVVRNLGTRSVYTVGKGGFLDHLTGKWVSVTIRFTSDLYKKVDLG